MENRKYYLGLDIGTDSVGYAVTDENYKPIKFRGEPMLGTHVFEARGDDNPTATRRGFRTARRRLDRRQQRVALIQDIFAKEISKVDKRFFIRIRESGLHREDVSELGDLNVFFNDPTFKDKDYYKKYPTIHHLIDELMNSEEQHDVRLVYIACAWLVAHRGHFLSEVDMDNIDEVTSFEPVYKDLEKYLAENEMPMWDFSISGVDEILKKKKGLTAKKAEIYSKLGCSKKTGYAPMLDLLCGGKAKLSALFENEEYDELEKASIELAMDDETLAEVYAQLGDDAELIRKLKAVYDWSVLTDILAGEKTISKAKIVIYDRHKDDLKELKRIVRKYLPEKYDDVFKKAIKGNYASYVANYKTHNFNEDQSVPDKFKVKKEEFRDFLKKNIFSKLIPDQEDVAIIEAIKERIERCEFLPKQVDGNNRVIPYQLYGYELKTLLKSAVAYLPFLEEKDSDGLTAIDKILSVFKFRVPYYVGPLNSSSQNAWLIRRAEGKILPWNFDSKIDLEASENEFIRRMTNKCTYLPDEDVLPKYSMLYCKFNVLNEINNITVNGIKISAELKQGIYESLFLTRQKVTVGDIKKYLWSNGVDKTAVVSGLDESIKSSLKPQLEFRRLLESKTLTDKDVEEIIERSTCTENKKRLKKWIKESFSQLSAEDVDYLASRRYTDFGRLSRKLLEDILVKEYKTGEVNTVIGWMWNTNRNFMQLMSADFDLAAHIENYTRDLFTEHPLTLAERLDSMYLSGAVKRPVMRTLDIVSDVIKAMKGQKPAKVFVEMARGGSEDQKGKRTQSRKQQIIDFYKIVKDESVKKLNKELEELGESADNKLQSDALFLYFMQLGKCMYTGQEITLSDLKKGNYNIDHIYPRSLVKDDSLLNNRVLVTSKANEKKGDNYPVPEEFRSARASFWEMLNSKVHDGNKMLTDEKYKRLVRTTPFTDEEKWSFINRQLVETRQSTKAVATLLKERFGEDCEIVYVKAGLVSEFRHEVLNMHKTRAINDLHHAKDAYLNIVVGNVYHTRFTEEWFFSDNRGAYNVKAPQLFGHPVEKANWKGGESIAFVRKVMSKNAIHYTRYAFCRKGGLFNQMPLKAAEGLVPRKAGLETAKYGGYGSTTASFYVLAEFTTAKGKDAMFVPIELMVDKKFCADREFAEQYVKEQIARIEGKEILSSKILLGGRTIKINTVLAFDGLRFCIAGKDSGGSRILLRLMTSNIINGDWESYVKAVERVVEKTKKNGDYIIDEEYDRVTATKNIEIYRVISKKVVEKPFCMMPGLPVDVIKQGEREFASHSIKEQCEYLLQLISVFKTGRAGPCDLSGIGGSGKTAVLVKSAKLSGLRKGYKDIHIIDSSASGLFETRSENLLELL